MLKLKKILKITLIGFILWIIWLTWIYKSTTYAIAPSFTDNVWERLINKWKEDVQEKWRLYFLNVDRSKNIKENIRNLLYPTSNWWWQLRDFLKNIMYAIMVIIVLYYWAMIIYDAEQWIDKYKEYTKQLIFSLMWCAIVLFATYIFSWWLDVSKWSEAFIKSSENNLLFNILVFLKAFAFFLAIIFMLWNWYSMMRWTWEKDSLEKWKNWVLSIVVALVFIKIIDYVYFILQAPNLKQKFTDFLIEITKMLWYLIWAFAVVMIIYAWFRMITDRKWSWTWIKHFKNAILWAFIAAVVIFLFLLIMYQVVQEFA